VTEERPGEFLDRGRRNNRHFKLAKVTSEDFSPPLVPED
jgi:hypothetical protein